MSEPGTTSHTAPHRRTPRAILARLLPIVFMLISLGVPMASAAPVASQAEAPASPGRIDSVVLAVEKVATPDPDGRHPGDTITFTITVRNDGQATMILIPARDVYVPADLDYVSASPAPSSVNTTTGELKWDNLGDFMPGNQLSPGQSYAFTVNFIAKKTGTTTNTIHIEGATDDYGVPAPPVSAQAPVTITEAPAIQVTKTANPTSLPEPGGPVVFTVAVKNTSASAVVTISSLVDSIHGNLNGVGSCSVSQTLNPGQTYTCSFTANVTGNAAKSETDTVVASGTDNNGSPVSGQDNETVTITNVTPVIVVTKTANPTSLLEPGGAVAFTVRIDNPSTVDPVTINSLVDNIHGNLNGKGSCVTPQTILPGSYYQCVFSANVTGNAGKTETDTVTATGTDDDGTPVSGQGNETVTITNAIPQITVIKVANPVSLPEPGGAVMFQVWVYNLSTVEPVTINSLVDSIHGDLNGQGTCAMPKTLAAGGSYYCEFLATITGNAGKVETDIVTATGADDDGTPVTGKDDATVTLTNTPSAIVVEKTVNPTTLTEPGGLATFTVKVTNTSAVDTVTLNSLIDNLHGNLNGQGDCATPKTLTAAAAYTCTFTASISGNAGKVETDIVVAAATDDDGNPLTAQDDATVSIISAGASIRVTKTASPTSLPEPGGPVAFTVRIDNTSPVSAVTLSSLVDSVYGGLNGKGDCATPKTIAAGSFYQCSFTASLSGNAGKAETDTVTATGTDNTGKPVTGADSETVTLTNLPSAITVLKTATPTSLVEPGGAVVFTVKVTNTSAVDAVTINALVDSIHGDLNGQGTCATPKTLAAGAAYTCTFTASITGNAGKSETDTVTATGVDDDQQPVTGQDNETVTITNSIPVIRVNKSANPTTIVEPGGMVVFTVRIDNDSTVDTVTITSLVDNIHGNLNGKGDCATPKAIPPGGFYQCTFSANVTGNAGYIEKDTVVAVGTDDDSTPVSAQDDATVTITNSVPTITVQKDPHPTEVEAPSGTVIFTVQVKSNSTVDTVTLSGLVDNIHGNVNGKGTCAVPQILPPGATYVCSFPATVSGAVGYTETDTVTATGQDDDDTPVSGQDTATVQIIKPTAIAVETLSAVWSGEGAELTWITRGDTRSMQFGLYRSNDPLLRGKLVGLVNAEPQSGADGSVTYKWVDPSATPGVRTYYRLQVIADGEETWYGPTEVASQHDPIHLFLPLIRR